jgi:hypothetical protein
MHLLVRDLSGRLKVEAAEVIHATVTKALLHGLAVATVMSNAVRYRRTISDWSRIRHSKKVEDP